MNCNLSNCENSPKKRFSGLQREEGFRGFIPLKPRKSFFSGYFRNCLNCDSLRWSHTHFICIPAVHIISLIKVIDNQSKIDPRIVKKRKIETNNLHSLKIIETGVNKNSQNVSQSNPTQLRCPLILQYISLYI